ncbi:MAG: beta-exotoxin transport system ATP-binding protein [Patescibacteria group bacterium]|nr:ABC transporter ATP-binding protein [Candidatus Saccharibacteria bacterium]MDQ5963329.1 beta-exotoxin transport system ATP-binding protein [Patescibacteria group bacterium]
MRASIDIRGLSKTYARSKTPALDNLTLQVHLGEVYGFLGANGAGKSTTIRLLLNFIQPTHGTATIMGHDVVRSTVEAKRSIGYLSGEVALWPKVTGNEIFAYLGNLASQNDSTYIKELIRRFEADPHKKIGELSKGNKQKIGIITALMHKPAVLILDEPTSGLDPLMQEVFYDCVREAAANGTAVFVSSHNLAEAQRMCDRIGIIKHGKLIHEQDIKDSTDLASTTMRITLAHQKDATELKKHRALKVISAEGATLVVRPSGSIATALGAISHYPVQSFSTEQLNLEDEFLEYYGDGA